jgi:hypothetical protein
VSAETQPEQVEMPGVFLELSLCPAEASREIVHLTQMELGNRLRAEAQDSTLRAAVKCGEDVAELTIADPHASTRSELISLTATPEPLRPRVIALQLAELVRSIDLQRENAQREPAPAPRTEAPLPKPVRARNFQLGAFAHMNSFSRDGRWLAGAGLSFGYDLRALSLGIDAALSGRSFEPSLGEVRVLWGYAAPQMAWLVRHRSLRFTLGAGYAVGVASIRGTATRSDAGASTRRGLWAAPFALLGLAFVISPALLLSAQASLGWVQAGVVGEVSHAKDVQLSGMWTQLRAGVVFAF